MKEENGNHYSVVFVDPTENTGSVKAFVTVETRDGLVISGISYHEARDGRKWVFLPGQPRIDDEGNVVRDPIDGRIQFHKILRFADRDKFYLFQRWVLSEINRILPEIKRPAKRVPEFRGRVEEGGAR